MCRSVPLNPRKADLYGNDKEHLIVLQLLNSELDLVVKSGFLYVPLLFDSDLAIEIQKWSDSPNELDGLAFGKANMVLELDGIQYIKSLAIQSILANYEKIDRYTYEQVKKELLPKSNSYPGIESILPHGKLQTIILKIMPHFIRKNRGLERRPFSDEDLLDLMSSTIDIPQRFIELADQYVDSGSLLRALDGLDKGKLPVEPLREGPVAGEALRLWIREALGEQIVNLERMRLRQEIRNRERLGEARRNHVATLLYIAEKGSFELDGFGFSRVGSRDDYVIYKRTGEYILKDYYARSYRFPDCRVAVSTSGPLRPLVLDYYKHPFLSGYAQRQEICMRDYNWPDKFSADNIIMVLEDGINSLLYGYDARRRNGYHSLDPTLYYVKTIEFIDYRI
jgi:hypothetical protein